jgi:hypothetical protein
MLDIVIAANPSRDAITSYRIYTVGEFAHATGWLHFSDIKNDFGICTASSTGCFVSKTLLDRIPTQLRPSIASEDQRMVNAVLGGPARAIGSAEVPFYIVDEANAVRLHFTLKFLVLPDMEQGMLVPYSLFQTFLSDCKNGGAPQWSVGFLKPVQLLDLCSGALGQRRVQLLDCRPKS